MLQDLPCPCASVSKQVKQVNQVNKAHKSAPLYRACCARYIEQGNTPLLPEQLMRSRYSAYVLQNRDYLLRTWHPDTRPKDIEFEAGIKWLGLEVRKHIITNTITQDSALVEFVARYRVGGKGQRLQEKSYFVKLNGSWFYSHGDMLA